MCPGSIFGGLGVREEGTDEENGEGNCTDQKQLEDFTTLY